MGGVDGTDGMCMDGYGWALMVGMDKHERDGWSRLAWASTEGMSQGKMDGMDMDGYGWIWMDMDG